MAVTTINIEPHLGHYKQTSALSPDTIDINFYFLKCVNGRHFWFFTAQSYYRAKYLYNINYNLIRQDDFVVTNIQTHRQCSALKVTLLFWFYFYVVMWSKQYYKFGWF